MSAFSITGEFAGYVRLATGKRRMVLRTLDQELVLKIPRELRQELDGMLVKGMTITVTGEEENDGEHCRPVVSEVVFGPGQTHVPWLVRVCSKKNCWRAGGRELAHLLEKEVEAAGLEKQVRIKPVGCLDCCKYPPAIACNDRVIPNCDAACARALIARLRTRTSAE